MGKHPPGTDVGGRPTKYHAPTHDIIVENLVRENKTMEEIAKIFEVTTSTVYEWQSVHQSFSEAIKRGREQLLDRVEYNLYQRACGIEYTEEKTIAEGKRGKDGKIEEGSKMRIEKIKRYIPPDTGAGCFLLKTQRPDKYKEIQNLNVTEVPTIIDDIEEGD